MPDFDHSVLGTREHPTLGLDTFGDAPLDGAPGNHPQTLREVVAEAVLADRVGVDYIGLGEHHRPDYAISAPDVVLAAIAGQTERIRLGTGVTVLSSDDPIRVYQRFATLDAVSSGRAEVQLGRGSFVESFGLFGLELSDYDRLFAEKVDLFAALQREEPVTWEGTVRPPLVDQRVYPTTAAGRVPAWIGVGGTPQSVVRAAQYGMPLMLAVIGGSPASFVQLADLYREALGRMELPELPIGMHSPGHVAATDDEAREQLYPHQAELYTRLGRERGWPAYSRLQFEQAASAQGALFVGSPETVAQKIAWAARTLGLSRFQLKYSVGSLPHEQRLESVRLYGEEVIPRVRELLAGS
jgi:probable LLM family oxidoreductase